MAVLTAAWRAVWSAASLVVNLAVSTVDSKVDNLAATRVGCSVVRWAASKADRMAVPKVATMAVC